MGFLPRAPLGALALWGHLVAAWAQRPLCRELFNSSTDDWTDCRVQIGGLADRGPEAFEQSFGRVFSGYLSEAFNASRLEFEAIPLGFGHDTQRVHNASLDFLFSNPAVFVCTMVESGVRAVASLVRFFDGNALDRFGGVIFSLSASNFTKPEDLQRARIATPGISSLGGTLMQLEELLSMGFDVMTEAEQLTFTGSQDQVIEEVLNGSADVGFVRTGVIERSVAENLTMGEHFQIINPMEGGGFPFRRSTAFSPEWIFGALPHVPHGTSKEVGGALMALDRFSQDPVVSEPAIAGDLVTFVPPMNYLDLLWMLERVGYFSGSSKRCVDPTDALEALRCPEGWAKQQPDAASCPAELCKAEYTCLCHPCVRLKEPELLFTVQAVPNSWAVSVNSSDVAARTQIAPNCSRMAQCAVVARGQVLTWTLLDQIGNAVRARMGVRSVELVEMRLGLGGSWHAVDAEHVVVDGLSTERYAFNVTMVELGEAILQLRINGQESAASPVLVEVFEPPLHVGAVSQDLLDWATTVDAAGLQRALSQVIAMEYLLIVHGVEEEAHRAALNASIWLYDERLRCLIRGCPEKHILAAPSFLVARTLEALAERWEPFMAMLLSGLDTMHSISSSADYATLRVVSTETNHLLEDAETVVDYVVEAAQVNGVEELDIAESIAARQRMVIVRICKEAFLLGLGVEVELGLTKLRSLQKLFEDALRGIITGASWVGVNRIEKRCTLQALREVTYEWNQFSSLLDQVLVADTPRQSQARALKHTHELFEAHQPVFTTMASAVELVFYDDGTCEVPEVPANTWAAILDTVARHRAIAQTACQLLLQIVLGIDVDRSTVQLTVSLKNGQLTLEGLIEGNKAGGLPSPPTQSIVDELILVSETWAVLFELFTEAVNSQYIDRLHIHQMSMLSVYHFSEMGVAVAMYETAGNAGAPGSRASLLSVVGRQSALIAKVSKEALLVIYGEEPAWNAAAVNSTRDLFMDVHWKLLLGARASNITPSLERSSQLCVVQQMSVVADRFDELQRAALGVAAGNRDAVEALVTAAPLATEAMKAAEQQYAAEEPSCDPVNASIAEWINGLLALGEVRALTQTVSVLRLTAAHGNDNSIIMTYSSQLQLALTAFTVSLRAVVFGSSGTSVPPPFSQAYLDDALRLLDLWEDWQEQLSGSASASQVSELGLALLDKAEELMSLYMAAASSALSVLGAGVSVLRLDTASRLSMLCHKVVKEALLVRFEGALTAEDMESSIDAFEAAHLQLRHGGEGLQRIIPERPDLLEKWGRANELWRGLKSLVRPAALQANGSSVDALMQQLHQLELVLDASTLLFALPDPEVIPKVTLSRFPYKVLAYCSLSVFLLFVAVAGCVKGWSAK